MIVDLWDTILGFWYGSSFAAKMVLACTLALIALFVWLIRPSK